MSIYPKFTKTSSADANNAALNSNEASTSNPFITQNDLIADGLNHIVLVAPDGGKWKVTVDNSGTLDTTAL